jgi:hypothetical protein
MILINSLCSQEKNQISILGLLSLICALRQMILLCEKKTRCELNAVAVMLRWFSSQVS